MGFKCFTWAQKDPMAERHCEAGHLLTGYQRFSHSSSRTSSKPSSPLHAQLSEIFPGVVESCMALPELVVVSLQGNYHLLSMGYSDVSVSLSAQSLCQIPLPLRHMRAAASRKLLCAKRWLEKELLLT